MDDRLLGFVARLSSNYGRVRASLLAREAVGLFRNYRDKDYSWRVLGAPELLGETQVLERCGPQPKNSGVSQFGVWFFFDPKALLWELNSIVETYLAPAIWQLQSRVVSWAEFVTGSLELPQGVEDAALERVDNIEIRCIIDKMPAYHGLGIMFRSRIPAEWITRERWYDISIDEFVNDVPLAPVLRFDIRAKVTVPIEQ